MKEKQEKAAGFVPAKPAEVNYVHMTDDTSSIITMYGAEGNKPHISYTSTIFNSLDMEICRAVSLLVADAVGTVVTVSVRSVAIEVIRARSLHHVYHMGEESHALLGAVARWLKSNGWSKLHHGTWQLKRLPVYRIPQNTIQLSLEVFC